MSTAQLCRATSRTLKTIYANPPRWRIALARMRLARADYVGDRETDDHVGPLCLPSYRAPLNVQDVEQVVWVPRSHLIQTATH